MQMQMPSGRTVAMEWTTTGRALTMDGQRNGNTTHYLAEAQYTAHGGLAEAKLGNGLWERWSYLPDRLMPWKVQLGSQTQASSVSELQFAYCSGMWGSSCGTNNGNILGQKILPLDVTQNYTYDGVNRLKTASENASNWIEAYDYDVHGNLWWEAWSESLGTRHLMLPKSSAWYRTGNNRVLPPSEDPDAVVEAAHYDAAGNLKQFGMQGLEYDRENRLSKATGSGVTEYRYDGLGRRVVKEELTGATTYYVYDAFGQLAAEYQSGGQAAR